MRYTAIVLAGAVWLSPSLVQAQTRSPGWMERTFGINIQTAVCTVAPVVIGGVIGAPTATAAVALARALGLCPATPPSVPNPPSTPLPAPSGPQQPSLPGLQVRVLSVKGTTDAPVIGIGGPTTTYANGEGFALIVASNAPGYLEVWSLDDDDDTFVEGIVLDPERASVVTLPAVVQGAYRFDTAGGRDTLRLKYLPCRPVNPQSFTPVANARVAQAVSAASPAVQTMTTTLPSCPFTPTVSRTTAQLELFSRMTEVRATFLPASNAYTAVLDPSIAPNARSIAVDIEFRRQ